MEHARWMISSAVIIYNPAARGAAGKRLAEAIRFLKTRGITVDSMPTQCRGDAEAFAKQAVTDRPSLIIAAGGDGTINEVINGMAGSDVPLAILPLGTANVLARECGIGMDVGGALGFALENSPKAVSLGLISYRLESGDELSRYFCLMAGIGFDAKAVYDLSPGLKRFSGKMAYVMSGFRNAISYSPEELVFNIDGRVSKGYSAIIGNASRYGGDFMVTPEARLSDPHLYACIFKGRKGTDLIRYAYGVLTGRHLKYADILYERASAIVVQGKAHIQVDGDYLGITPARITVARDALRLICLRSGQTAKNF